MTELQFSPTFDQRAGVIDPLKAQRRSKNWYVVEFKPAFPEDRRVIVIPMTQTYFGNQTPGLRVRKVTNRSFQIRIDEVISSQKDCSSDGAHVPEVVGWVAYGIPK
ncbi:MAG: hypothetical protein B6242_09875 [Anaerolineaceae bacterium 4572_78]|nr:MAG: hypothetical protein B6242_09875 [Anaerolineaceae bacterium 4572_78]